MVVARWRQGKQIEVEVREHKVMIDQPRDMGGQDSGPTSTEFLAVSLAACSVHYALPFLERRGIPPKGLSVSARMVRADNPKRIGRIELVLTLPTAARGRLSDREKEGILRAAHTCYVQRTIVHQPEIAMQVVEKESPGE